MRADSLTLYAAVFSPSHNPWNFVSPRCHYFDKKEENAIYFNYGEKCQELSSVVYCALQLRRLVFVSTCLWLWMAKKRRILSTEKNFANRWTSRSVDQKKGLADVDKYNRTRQTATRHNASQAQHNTPQTSLGCLHKLTTEESRHPRNELKLCILYALQPEQSVANTQLLFSNSTTFSQKMLTKCDRCKCEMKGGEVTSRNVWSGVEWNGLPVPSISFFSFAHPSTQSESHFMCRWFGSFSLA